MCKYLNFIIFTIIIIKWKACYSDIAFNHLKSYGVNIFKETAKHWYAYIEMFITKKVTNQKLFDVYITDFLFKAFRQSQTLVNKRKRPTNFGQSNIMKILGQRQIKYVVIKWTTTNIYINKPLSFSLTYSLLFNVDKR